MKQWLKATGVWLWSKRIWLGVVIILLVIVQAQVKARTAEESVLTEKVTRRDLTKTLEVTGIVDAKEKIDLHFIAPSQLSWVGVTEGDRVNKWQAIASVDTRTLQKQLQQDLNNFSKEFRDHDQTLDDYDFYGDSEINLEIKRILENAQFDLENEVLDVEIRALAIKLSSLVTPISGLMSRIDQPIAGVNILPTDIFQVVNPETMFFRTVIDEEDIGLIRSGQEASVELDAFVGEPILTTVDWVAFSPSASEGGGTGYSVDFLLPINNEALRYKLGMNGTVRIGLDKRDDVLVVPVDSLIFRDDGWYVDKLEDGLVERVKLEVGLETEDYVEVVSGLEEGDEVVLPNGL